MPSKQETAEVVLFGFVGSIFASLAVGSLLMVVENNVSELVWNGAVAVTVISIIGGGYIIYRLLGMSHGNE